MLKLAVFAGFSAFALAFSIIASVVNGAGCCPLGM